ncbi:MAG: cell shape determination protein CcmA [Candidatus Rokuibacteriota bacterium]|nr:MAG: cell shape determination protein CcmA [Candidatus Rokubacteria bacterium]
MWKPREEPSRPTSVPASPAQAPYVPVQTPSLAAQTPSYSSTSSGGDQTQKEPRSMHEELASIGKSIVINGELSGSEDLTIEGRVDGKIELRDHVLTVGSNGRIKAQVSAKAIVVLGQVTGNLNATEKVDIKESGSVEGDIVAPRVAIADGSHFKGSIDMQKKEQPEKGLGNFTKPESKHDSKTPKPETSKPEPSPVNGEFVRV